MNEHSPVGDRDDHIVLDEGTNEPSGGPLIDIRRRDAGRISILSDQFGFELT